jgi:hypothetical protein
MDVQREGGMRSESGSAMPGEWSWSRQLASTRSVVRPDSQFDRYLVTACCMMLAVVLVVGAGGYAGIHGLSSSTTTTAKLATLEQLNREADPDRIFAPAAIALAMIAVFLVTISACAGSPREYPIDTE